MFFRRGRLFWSIFHTFCVFFCFFDEFRFFYGILSHFPVFGAFSLTNMLKFLQNTEKNMKTTKKHHFGRVFDALVFEAMFLFVLLFGGCKKTIDLKKNTIIMIFVFFC